MRLDALIGSAYLNVESTTHWHSNHYYSHLPRAITCTLKRTTATEGNVPEVRLEWLRSQSSHLTLLFILYYWRTKLFSLL